MPRLEHRIPLRARQLVVRSLPDGLWERLSPTLHGEASWQRSAGTAVARAATRRRVGAGGDEQLPVRSGGRSFLGRSVERFTAADALDGNLATVVTALRQAGVPHWLVAARPGERRVVGLPASRRADLGRALRDFPGARQGYLAAVEGDRLARVRPADRPLPDRATVLRYFDVLATPQGQELAAGAFGCDVELWQDRAGTLHAPRPNRYAVEIPPAEQKPAVRRVGDLDVDTFPAFEVPHVFDVDFPVDVVYTWVDGSDPAWVERKRRAWEQVAPGSVSDFSANSSRYLSRDELRYSLRSLDAYAPWVRTVYLVTDDQVPAWLDTTNPRIRVVSHQELFAGTGRLPTFNSHAIESRLHRIEGLSEHYLYLNDDVFFGRPVSPELFFGGNGTSRFFLSRAHVALGEPAADELPVMSAGKNNRELIRRRSGRVLTHKLKHVPHPQQRSVLEEMEKEFGEEFARTAASPFRHPDDISVPSALFPYYAWMAGRAAPGDIRYYYADIASPKTSARLRRVLRDRDYDVFCLNDHDTADVDPEEQVRLILDFLRQYFPLPGAFER